MILDFLDGLHKGEVVVQHEVGQHQGGRSAHSHSTVYQDLPCEEAGTETSERLLSDGLAEAGEEVSIRG